ncbi:MAG: hypothetical protein FJ385_07130 [Verrucomicrobia bacterium]|nr:hypothetical protein [Verrucomicrobiota bacterium]
MFRARRLLVLGVLFSTAGCAWVDRSDDEWKQAVRQQTGHLGYRNWIIVAEASFPAHSRPGLRLVTTPVEIPEAVDFVIQTLERTEHLRPHVYLTRELRSVENDYAPGMDSYRTRIRESLHGHDATELEQQSLMTLVEDTVRSFDVLVVRTRSALPYSSVFIELHPGYWDAESEIRLRERIEQDRKAKASPAVARVFTKQS